MYKPPQIQLYLLISGTMANITMWADLPKIEANEPESLICCRLRSLHRVPQKTFPLLNKTNIFGLEIWFIFGKLNHAVDKLDKNILKLSSHLNMRGWGS